MKRKLLYSIVPGFVLILIFAACLPAGMPTASSPNTLETIVAATLTAVSANAPEQLPAETSAPEPAFTPPRALQVAYIKNGNVYVWTEGEGSVGLTNSGNASSVDISDDGQVIAYVRQDQGNFVIQEIWAVNTSGPSNDRLLVSSADFAALKASSPYPDAEGMGPDFITWKPRTHLLAYSTVPMFMGPGYAPGEDLRLVHADTLEKTTIFEFGAGGHFYFSPDGRQVALSKPESISLANADGSNLRANVLTFPLVGTYSEYQYRPRPHWASDSSALRVAIPPADTLATPTPPTSLWSIPADGSPATRLGEILAIPFAWPDTAFSPNLDRVAYVKSIGEPAENRRELHLANPDGTGDVIYTTDISVEFLHWTPDGSRFVYVIHDGPNRGIYLGSMGGTASTITTAPNTTTQIRWVDQSRFLFLYNNNGIWELRISDVDGSNHAFIDTIPDSYATYDFTK
ncbi:MAG: hypothetical protein Kow002_17100 [Anaerolineales bacterium]